MKKILVLGGTMFVGRVLVEKLIATPGYDVTLFNRGKSNTNIFTGVKQIHGDRESDDIKQIFNHDWDCVFDFSGYYPYSFKELLLGLKGSVRRYVFISTISVYDIGKFIGNTITEADETLDCTEEQKTSKLMAAYGEKKAEMERALMEQEWLDKIIFRPSFIYGKYDWTERFYYWLYRAKFSNKVLMPDGGTPFSLSITNASDLVEVLLQSVNISKHQTVYNTISQPAITLREIVSITAGVLNNPQPEIISVDEKNLKNLKLNAGQFPLFMPINFKIDDSRWAKDFSFKKADIGTTFMDMLDHKAASCYPLPGTGLSLEKEKEAIAGL